MEEDDLLSEEDLAIRDQEGIDRILDIFEINRIQKVTPERIRNWSGGQNV